MMLYIQIVIFLFSHAYAKEKAPENTTSPMIGMGVYGGYYNFPGGGYNYYNKSSVSEGSDAYYPMYGMGVDQNQKDKSTLGQTSTLLATIIDKIPDKNLQNGLREYVKIVNPKAYHGDSVGGSNSGLVQYFSKRFQENACVRDAAKNFYADVATKMKKMNLCDQSRNESSAEISKLESQLAKETDSKIKSDIKMQLKYLSKENKPEPVNETYGCYSNRPSLLDRVGVGEKSYLDEGWLMRLALKHSNGNPEAALELIGMCGHDDVSQGHYTYFDDSDAAKSELSAQTSKLKGQKKNADEELKESFKKFNTDQESVYLKSMNASMITKQLEFNKMQTGLDRQMNCPPQNSDFYLSGSMSSTADISSSLKQKITDIQGKGNSGKEISIPSKHYHVYASAFLGCKMVRNGMTQEQAVVVQKQAARLYRGIRMCQAANESNSDSSKEFFKKELGVDFNETAQIENKVLSILNEKNSGKFECKSKKKITYGMGMMVPGGSQKITASQTEDDSIDTSKCKILKYFGISKLTQDESSVAKSKILNSLQRDDVAVLYRNWYFGGSKILGKDIPCTDLRYKGPTDLMKPNESILGKVFKPSGWSTERYEAASKRLATWDVDFEWTIAQHEAGSKYGAQICDPKNNQQRPYPFDDKSCLSPVKANPLSGFPGYGGPAPTTSVK